MGKKAEFVLPACRESLPGLVVKALVFCGVLLFPLLCQAGPANSNINVPGFYGTLVHTTLPNITPNTIPTLKGPGTVYGNITYNPQQSNDPNGSSQYTITQNTQYAIIDWSTFNIGSNSTVQFYQNKGPWAATGVGVALNRIWDTNPSQIYGQLRADGKIFLINQNGILFGPGSIVNVNGLVASALNIRNVDFLDYYLGLNKVTSLNFYLEPGDGSTEYVNPGTGQTFQDYGAVDPVTGLGTGPTYSYNGMTYNGVNYLKFTPAFPTPLSYALGSNNNPIGIQQYTGAAVSNFGDIEANSTALSLGSVYLIGPIVENGGTINQQNQPSTITTNSAAGLVAGTGALQTPLTLTPSTTGSAAFTVGIPDTMGGWATNMNTGALYGDVSAAGMYGWQIEQDGYIRSITAVRQNGRIELLATSTGTIITGPNSLMESPILDSTTDTADYAYPFSGGKIIIGGLVNNPQPALIDLQGTIKAPAGDVEIGSSLAPTAATPRVYLAGSSVIDVSGIWANEPASDLLVQAQMNSVELQDAYPQKGGPLQGQTITFNEITGTSIGNVTGEILAQLLTAREKAINGGQINMYSFGGDVIVMQGAQLNFSGGGIHYTGGLLNTTEVLAGGKIYNISNVPSNLPIQSVLSSYSKTNSRFGVTQSWSGIYAGGGLPLLTNVAFFDKGGNAGSLGLFAEDIVLDGTLNCTVTQGPYQTVITPGNASTVDTTANLDFEQALLVAFWRGVEVPSGGSVTLDATDTINNRTVSTNILTSINIQQDVPAQTNLSTTSPLVQPGQAYTSNISAQVLNNASLSNLTLLATSNITIGPNVNLALLPAGAAVNQAQIDHNTSYPADYAYSGFSAYATQIQVYGSVTAPSGWITLSTLLPQQNNAFVSYGTIGSGTLSQLSSEIFLGSSSLLDVSGEKIDNSVPASKFSAGQIQGGTITIQDQNVVSIIDTNDPYHDLPVRPADVGLFIQSGAVLDVSGGYQISPKGQITGGNAGALYIEGQTVMLNGDLRGYALANSQGQITGGTITLQALGIQIGGTVPANQSTLYLPWNFFADTGFTNITLDSYTNITIDPSARIAPSLVKLTTPGRSSGIGVPFAGPPGLNLIQLNTQWAYQTGPSSITLNSDDPFGVTGFLSNMSNAVFLGPSGTNIIANIQNTNPNLTLPYGASIITAPGGKISLNVNGDTVGSSSSGGQYIGGITIAGELEAPGGSIQLAGDYVHVAGTGQILAAGYNRPDTTSAPKGFGYNQIPLNGGTVQLSAVVSSVTLDPWSLIDISGPMPVTNTLLSASGSPVTVKEAGNPGSLELDYLTTLTLNGTINATPGQGAAGVQGGTMTIKKSSGMGGAPMVVGGAGLNLPSFETEGFDALDLISTSSIWFSGYMDVTFARQLILNTPAIFCSGNASDNMTLRSPWITLENTYGNYVPGTVPTSGNGQFTLSTGPSVPLTTGWIDVIGAINMNGFSTVTLNAGRDIQLSDFVYGRGSSGLLWTAGNLVLTADRIYPTMMSTVMVGGMTSLNQVIDDPTFNTYTFSPSQFALQAGVFDGSNGTHDIQGTVSIYQSAYQSTLPAGSPGPAQRPIYSAGTTLSVIATKGINVAGTLSAPMGAITLTTASDYQDNAANPNPVGNSLMINNNIASGSYVNISTGGVVTTQGTAMVAYGFLSSDGQDTWEVGTVQQPTLVSDNLSTLFQNSVIINADQATVATGGTINTSGGSGSVFPFQWREDVTGSADPLLPVQVATGKNAFGSSALPYTALQSPNGNTAYVVISGNAVPDPGPQVYLNGGGGLSPGYYTLLPVQYAFLPGAYIIEKQSAGSVLPGQGSLNNYGYPLVHGSNTTLYGTVPQIYTVRTAAGIVTNEAAYDGLDQQTTIGNGGGITVSGTTVVLAGSLLANPYAGNDPLTGQPYLPGDLSFSATNIYVQPVLNTSQAGAGSNLFVTAGALSGGGNVYLGGDPSKSTNTISIEIDGGATVTAPSISLNANNTITVDAGATLHATGNGGTGYDISLTTSQTGTAYINGTLYAHQIFSLNTPNLVINPATGILKADDASITLKSSAIFFGGSATNGLLITNSLWNQLSGFENITLQSISNPAASGIFFQSGFSLSASNSFTLDASRIVGSPNAAVTLSANTVTLENSGSPSTVSSVAGNPATPATFTVNAANINIGGSTATGASNDVLFSNFNTINLISTGIMTLKGQGSLTTGKADLNINAARVTAAALPATYNTNGSLATPYTAPNFYVYTGSNYYNDFDISNTDAGASYNPVPVGAINIYGGTQGAPYAPGTTAGGTLAFWGTSITLGDTASGTAGVIQADAATINLVATGSGQYGNIVLQNSSEIFAMGTNDLPGGVVTLQSGGGITLNPGSLIDVSAGAEGDAGAVTLSAPNGPVAIGSYTLMGTAQGGAGGSFVLDNKPASGTNMDMTDLIAALNNGGFTESINITARTGNITIAGTDQTLAANQIILTASDSGNGQINVYGKVDASQNGAGGTVKLNAMNNLTVYSGGMINGGSGANLSGWSVYLGSEKGTVAVNSGAVVNGGGGNIYLRALQNGTDVNITLSSGALINAPGVYAEAFTTNTPTAANLSNISAWLTSLLSTAESYYNSNQAVARLNNYAPGGAATFHLLTGIEVDDSSGTFTVGSNVNLGSATNPGVLTIREAGNLNINANVTDSVTNSLSSAPPARDSWGINLVAGADLSSADYMAVTKSVNGTQTGDLTLASGAVVYTESAPLNFASARDTVINSGNAAIYMINSYMAYNIASYAGNIQGNVGRDLIINGGAIQTATGDIDVIIGRDLQLNTVNSVMGAIRTTGQLNPALDTALDPTQYWTYAGGGNITLSVGRSVGTMVNGTLRTAENTNAWDYYYIPNSVITGGAISSSTRSYTLNTSDNVISFTWNGRPYTAYLDTGYSMNASTIMSGAYKTGGGTPLQTVLNDAVGPGENIFTCTYNATTRQVTIQNNSRYPVTNFTSNDGNYLFTKLNLAGILSADNETIPGSSQPNYWAADYGSSNPSMTVGIVTNSTFYPTAGLATMGGGNLYVRTGGDFLAQAGTFGQQQNSGLSIYAGGNINGNFLNFNGTGEIHAAGNFGSSAEKPTIELGGSSMTVTSGGDLNIGEVVNPTNASLGIMQTAMDWDLTYTTDTSITLMAGGNLTYYGTTDIPFYSSYAPQSGQTVQETTNNLLPANVDIEAAGNIDFMQNIVLAPSPNGNLILKAAGNISGNTGFSFFATVTMAGLPVSDVFYNTPLIHGADSASYNLITNYLFSGGKAYFGDPGSFPSDPLHSGDSVPVTIYAGQDIVGLNLQLPKAAQITAGRDITDVWYSGQNAAGTDVSTIIAGRNILLSSSSTNSGFNQAGPGYFIVEAGDYIDMGSSQGITTSGNGNHDSASYSALNIQGAGLFVISGYTIPALQSTLLQSENLVDVLNFINNAGAFFAGLQTAGITIANDMSSGNGNFNADLQKAGQSVRNFLPAPNTADSISAEFPGTARLNEIGNINMTSSTINTNSGKIYTPVFGNAGIFIIAGGNVNVGRSVFSNASTSGQLTTGIMTFEGGDLNIFAVNDVNVNESRVATALGGDITIWSEQGSINAGRGSKTEVSLDSNGDPMTGSGIRAVTYAPDGAGPVLPPLEGNVYLSAFNGIVDAGEAGISGNNVYIGAEQVVNAQNITATSSVVGVPQAAAAPTSIGGLSGTNSATQGSQSMNEVSAANGRNAQAAQMLDNVMMNWLDVKVIDFVQDDQGTNTL